MNENNNEPIVEITAGEMLRNARTTGRRKREIPTIAKQLCIREEFLQALEDGNYTFIPEVVYILGFARNYAMELGLDPDEIVTKIKREMGLVQDCSNDADGDVPAACAAPDSVKKVGAIKRVYLFARRNWKWFLGGLVAIMIIIIAVLALMPRDSDMAAVADTGTPVVAVSEPAYKTAVRERFGTENRASANVIIQAAQESWVKIEDGRGNTVFSRVLVPGDVYYMPQGDKYKGTFGNAGGVDIWVDGKLAPKIGENHTRKTGVSMAADSLIAGAAD